MSTAARSGVRRDDGAGPLRRVRSALGDVTTSSPARFAIIVFSGLILVTTLLLTLPIARAGGRARMS